MNQKQQTCARRQPQESEAHEKQTVTRIHTEKGRTACSSDRNRNIKAVSGKVRGALEENPVIAAVRSPESAEIVLKTSVQVVFLVEGDLFAYIPVITKLAEAGRFVFVHLDLIDGIGKDPAGLRFMAEHTAITGIISTKSTPLKHAAACRLLTIQRIFLIDSSSIKSGIKLIEASSPDFVEVMPALIPKAITALTSQLSVPVICGGMISEKNDMINALNAGASGVSVSSSELWRA